MSPPRPGRSGRSAPAGGRGRSRTPAPAPARGGRGRVEPRASAGQRRGRGGAGGAGGARGGTPPSGRRPALGGDQVEGRQAVRELLATGRRPVRRLLVADGLAPSPQLDEIEALATRSRVRVETVSRARLEATARTDSHQGVVAQAQPLSPVDLDALCEPAGGGGSGPAGAPFLVVVDGVTDPHNLGALLRVAECAGVTGVVLPRHRAAHLTPTVTKVAAGAIEHLRFALVAGIPTALSTLRRLGVWTVGLAGEASGSLYDLEVVDAPLALVVGGEERGLAPLVRRRCDQVLAIPQHGHLPSLNVAAAAAVACFEVARRRSAA